MDFTIYFVLIIYYLLKIIVFYLFCSHQFCWICNPAAFVPLIKNICQHDSPTEPRGVKKINGENVKKALVPWYAMGGITTVWHFNAFSERH